MAPAPSTPADALAERLLERHLAATVDWMPHHLVPWAALDAPALALPAGVADALVMHALTEDALPYYTTALFRQLGDGGAWGAWIRRWTAEEARHGSALHDYLAVTRAVDLDALERARLDHLATAAVPTVPSATEAFAYLALQELATRVAHANTARALPDPGGRRLIARIAADEHLHHAFYRDVVAALLDWAPDATAAAIDRQVRHFVMPGHGMAGFAPMARAVAAAGIYSADVFLHQVVEPLVLGAWRLGRRSDLGAEGRRARDRTLQFIDRLSRISPRLDLIGAAEGDDAAPRAGS